LFGVLLVELNGLGEVFLDLVIGDLFIIYDYLRGDLDCEGTVLTDDYFDVFRLGCIF
jgi:hypothetical protein